MGKSFEDGGSWADGVIICALAMQFDLQLYFYDLRTNENGQTVRFSYTVNEGGKYCTIGLLLRNQHYDVVELDEHVTPALSSGNLDRSIFHGVRTAVDMFINPPKDAKAKEKYNKQASKVLLNTTLINTPTMICIDKKEFSLFDMVTKLLKSDEKELRDHSLHHMLTDPMISEPNPYYSSMQRDIYKSLLQDRYKLVVKHWWWISFLVLVSPSKMPALADLYHRVKAVFTAMYLSKDSNGKLIIPTDVEIAMIDTLLYQTIHESFARHQFYNCELKWTDPPLIVKQEEGSIDIACNMLKFKITRDTITQFISDLADKSIDTEAEITTLSQAKNIKKAELEDTEATLKSTTAEREGTEIELGNTRVELQTTETKLLNTEVELQTTVTKSLNTEVEAQASEAKLLNKVAEVLTTQAKCIETKEALLKKKEETAKKIAVWKKMMADLSSVTLNTASTADDINQIDNTNPVFMAPTP